MPGCREKPGGPSPEPMQGLGPGQSSGPRSRPPELKEVISMIFWNPGCGPLLLQPQERNPRTRHRGHSAPTPQHSLRPLGCPTAAPDTATPVSSGVGGDEGTTQGHGASRLVLGSQGAFQNWSAFVRFYTFVLKKTYVTNRENRGLGECERCPVIWWHWRYVWSVSAPHTGSARSLRGDTQVPGRATHLPKEVGHHHVGKGLGPSRDLGGQKQRG